VGLCEPLKSEPSEYREARLVFYEDDILKRALFTFGVGQHAELLNLVRTNFQTYATSHQLDFFDCPLGVTTAEQWGRHPAWWKILGCLELFRQGYDEIQWLDCDCVIMQPWRRLLLDELPPGKSLGLVVHQFCGSYTKTEHKIRYSPNTGSMVLRATARPLLEAMWAGDVSQPWWEQSALTELLGLGPKGSPELPTSKDRATNPWWEHIHELPFQYNVFDQDSRYPDPVFPHSLHVIRHAASVKFEARVTKLQQWLAELSAD